MNAHLHIQIEKFAFIALVILFMSASCENSMESYPNTAEGITKKLFDSLQENDANKYLDSITPADRKMPGYFYYRQLIQGLFGTDVLGQVEVTKLKVIFSNMKIKEISNNGTVSQVQVNGKLRDLNLALEQNFSTVVTVVNTDGKWLVNVTLGIGSMRTADSDGMLQVYVPAGEFTMGSSDSQIVEAEKLCSGCIFSNEQPQHIVTLDAFWIDRTEVTNAMFAKFIQETQYKTVAERLGKGGVFSNGSWSEVSGTDWRHPNGPQTNLIGLDQHPVVQVSWNDALAYCSWAGRQLPTEAQWEKAARGTDGRTYPWGNDPQTTSLANNKSLNDGYEFTAPVGSYPAGASPYGALDMAGNVWEWVNDWYDPTYYSKSPADNPTGPAFGESHVQRGGSWDNGDLHVAFRNYVDPNYSQPNFGFRCAAPSGK